MLQCLSWGPRRVNADMQLLLVLRPDFGPHQQMTGILRWVTDGHSCYDKPHHLPMSRTLPMRQLHL